MENFVNTHLRYKGKYQINSLRLGFCTSYYDRANFSRCFPERMLVPLHKKICKLLQKGRTFDKANPDNDFSNIKKWLSDNLKNERRPPLTAEQKELRSQKAKLRRLQEKEKKREGDGNNVNSNNGNRQRERRQQENNEPQN
ncbi:uncharacterized protein LOC123272726 [Cotesia glomerata]|uniref:uncharacterized protein LOC123272726 n=1 Tax=Cotesia glomerata TaxID=32391 RepID=UPI001D01F9BC|nr:uncharacterized protein LOC123272726 [Cotesia glomerata]